MKVKDAKKITESLTRTSKMPGLSYSLPAWACQTGSKLRKVKTSPCYGCYALKNNYTRYPAIKEAQYRRLDAINHPQWVEAMATLINSKKPDVFRWHDSGDVQDVDHLEKIFKVCELTPSKRHWMPTREAWIKDHMHMAPANLVVRFSSPMVDQGPVKSWANTSTVSTKSRSCPAPDNNNECGDCRACWDPLVKNIEYGKH